jgi:DNA-binding response OmpR family regulator
MGDTILIVDDDHATAEAIDRIMRLNGFDVLVAYGGEQALALCTEHRPNLVILDIIMPGVDGIEVAKRLRNMAEFATLPILFLTGKGGIDAKIEAYQQAQADDYLTKPFDMRELVLRVQALLRRAKTVGPVESGNRLLVGKLILDLNSFEVITPDRSVLLTPVEFELMHFLMSHADRVFSADQLLHEVWGYPVGTGMPDLVRVHIKNLRDKIEPNPSEPVYVRNLLRRGYLVPAEQRV